MYKSEFSEVLSKMMRLGIDRLLRDLSLQKELSGKRLALVGHPASVTSTLVHSLDALCETSGLKVTAAFGPQHGMRGEKQYNMIESEDYRDPVRGVPVYSLYGKVRRPTPEMMDSFDVCLFDLQDIGCRIYTYVTTLLYMLESCAAHKKPLWVLDRPNPAGRPIEGSFLRAGWESFVGYCHTPMRHGLTLGELAKWFVATKKLDVELRVIAMEDYDPNRGPGFGWPLNELAWVNPSPNIPNISSVRSFNGTVLIEGVNLSEGRGTTRPLELIGAPGLDALAVLKEMERFEAKWMEGVRVRLCNFEPTFDKFKGQLCSGLHLQADDVAYAHERYRPYRWVLSFLKAVKKTQPNAIQWRQPPYEYEYERLPVDLLTGGTQAREWVDDPTSKAGDLDRLLIPDETAWKSARKPYLLYPDN